MKNLTRYIIGAFLLRADELLEVEGKRGKKGRISIGPAFAFFVLAG